jgi:hypothetical protein
MSVSETTGRGVLGSARVVMALLLATAGLLEIVQAWGVAEGGPDVARLLLGVVAASTAGLVLVPAGLGYALAVLAPALLVTLAVSLGPGGAWDTAVSGALQSVALLVGTIHGWRVLNRNRLRAALDAFADREITRERIRQDRRETPTLPPHRRARLDKVR